MEIHAADALNTTIDGAFDAIVQGRHGDAFAVLGPHEDNSGFQITAWLPQAKSAALLIGGASIDARRVEMARVHDSGMFRAISPTREYQLEIRLYTGDTQVIDDPYRFPPLLTPFELHLHGEGTNYESYRTLGAHVTTAEGVVGTRFAVWAPNAQMVSVMGDFNGWDRTRHPARLRDGGIWELFLPGLGTGSTYKYSIRSHDTAIHEKCDPYGFYAEQPPKTASVVWPLESYSWRDSEWMQQRGTHDALHEPMSVYEVHLGSGCTASTIGC